MRRRLFTILSTLSLLLCIGAALLWLRSYRVGDLLYRSEAETVGSGSTQADLSMFSGAGGILFHRSKTQIAPDILFAVPGTIEQRISRSHSSGYRKCGPNERSLSTFFAGASFQWSGLGFGFLLVGSGYTASSEVFVTPSPFVRPGKYVQTITFDLRLPYWFFAAMSILPAAYLLRRIRGWRDERRQGRGLCQKCGYDLRASGERCPECGTLRGV